MNRFPGSGISFLRPFRTLIAAGAVFSLLACGSAPTADDAADTLKVVDDAYRVAVTAHDARPVCPSSAPSCEPADVHAAHRKVLVEMRGGLQTAWAGVIAWKRSNAGAAPAAVLAGLVTSSDAFLALAVDLHALTQKQADAVRAYLAAAFPGSTARKRAPGKGPGTLAHSNYQGSTDGCEPRAIGHRLRNEPFFLSEAA